MARLSPAFGGAAVLAGCLFPSFDDLKHDDTTPSGEERDAGKQKPDSSSSSTSGGATSSSSSGATSSSSSGATSSSSSSSSGSTTTLVRSIPCDGKTCGADEVCCAPIVGDAVCRPASSPSCDPGDLLECADTKDCAGGEICCQRGTGSGGSRCQKTACDGYTYCQPDAPQCPGGQSCSGDAIAGAHIDSFKNCE